ncbi:hypothetical protein TI04_11610 [Achromatium sp. WMS2]|nr:hypothetical protein TI04_11610 [Achromatium sp. WMS2]
MKLLVWLLLIGLSAALYLEWKKFPVLPPRIDQPQVTPNVVPDSSLAKPTTLPVVLKPRDSYGSIAENTLFDPSRSSAIAPEAAAAANFVEAEKLDGLVLNGIIIINSKPTAIIKDPQTNKKDKVQPDQQSPTKVYVTLGASIRGWTITQILKDRVILRSPNGKEQPLLLRPPKEKKQTVGGNTKTPPQPTALPPGIPTAK